MRTKIFLAASLSIVATGLACPVRACTMPLPPPEPRDPPHEIECIEDGISADGRLRYLVGIEITVMPPPQTATCMCGLNVGTGGLPASFSVTSAMIVVEHASGDMTPVDGFDSFEENAEVGKELAADDDALDGTESTGFEMEVEPVDPPELEPGDKEKMFFLVQFAPQDYNLVNGQLVQFGAGSDLAGHPLQIFAGYQANLVLPPLVTGDLNFDGIVDGGDLAQVLAAWGPCSGACLADLNHDGKVDGADLAIVLAAWT